MQSRQQLVLRALQELKVVGAGQPAAAEDAKIANDEVQPMLANLASRNIWQWGNPDSIDDDAFLHLAKWLANSIATAFGLPADENMRLLAEQNLRELKVTIRSGRQQTVDYF